MPSTPTYNYLDKTGLEYVLTQIHKNIGKMIDDHVTKAEDVTFDNTLTQLTVTQSNLQQIIVALKTLVDGKEDHVDGKGLSTNDFDDDYKDMLDGLADTLADYALLSGATFTGAVILPTVAAGTNDNTAATTAYVTSSIAEALKDVTGISFDGPYADYDTLVATVTNPKNGVIYLVTSSGVVPNAQDEYFWNGTNFELFGSTAVDISSCVKYNDITTYTQDEIKEMLTKAGYTITT